MKSSPGFRASGRFVLRIEPRLHRALREAARQAGLSLNDYCARKLAAPMGSINAADWSAAAVERAAVSFGENLLGVAAFGSWARGELAGGSDVDLLIVLESSVPITRSLYRDWDERSVTESPRKLDPHFVHLPALYGRIGAVWAEAAVDGIVLFERGFRLSSTLVRVRHEILEGRLVRKIVHGQPYWTEVA